MKIEKQMNQPSEQLSADKSLHIANDQPLTQRQIFNCLSNCFGADCCGYTSIDDKQVIQYTKK